MASSEESLIRLRQADFLFRKARDLRSQGDYSKAVSYCDRAIKQCSNHFLAWYTKADVLTKMERYREALEAYNQALTIEPDNSDVLYYQAGILHKLGQCNQAIANYDRLLENEDYRDYALFQKSRVLGFIREYSRALMLCEQLLTKSVINDAQVLVQKANLLCDQANTQREEAEAWTKKGNREEALEIYNSVLDPNTQYFPSVLMYKSLLLDDLGRKEEAEQARELAHKHVANSLENMD